MILFFSQEPIKTSHINPNTLLTLYNFYKRDLTKIYSYYHNVEKFVNNTHILVRILKNLQININATVFDLLDYLNIVVPHVENTFNINSIRNKTKILNNNIIGSSESILISRTYNINYFNLINNWKTLTPIKLIYYEGYGLEMNHPTNNEELITLSGFEIDVKLLALQYYYWCKDRILNNKSIDPTVFVYQYPLTNMIGNILDLSIINRIMYPENRSSYKSNHPFLIYDKTYNLNKEIDKQMKNIKKYTMNFTNVLLNIHLPYNENAFNLYKSETIIINTNNRNGEFILRSSICSYLLSLYGIKGLTKNDTIKHDLYLYIKQINSNKLDNKLPYNIKLNYDYIKKRLGVKR